MNTQQDDEHMYSLSNYHLHIYGLQKLRNVIL